MDELERLYAERKRKDEEVKKAIEAAKKNYEKNLAKIIIDLIVPKIRNFILHGNNKELVISGSLYYDTPYDGYGGDYEIADCARTSFHVLKKYSCDDYDTGLLKKLIVEEIMKYKPDVFKIEFVPHYHAEGQYISAYSSAYSSAILPKGKKFSIRINMKMIRRE